MAFHQGPTYQHISPSDIAGLALVAVVVIGFLSLFELKDIKSIVGVIAAAIVLFMLLRITILNRIRDSIERRSLLKKEEELFNDSGNDSKPK